MSADLPELQPYQPVDATVTAAAVAPAWGETALTALFAAAAVLFVSFVAVAAGII